MNQQNLIRFLTSILLTSIIICTNAYATDTQQEINVYSARKEYLIKPLLDQFSQKTGIKVKLLTGGADTLIKRIESEAHNTPADVLITVDAGRLYRAKKAGLLQSIESKVLNSNIPSHLRDPDKQWFGLSKRARIIMYNKDRVKAEELTTYQDLTQAKWKKRICIRSSDNIYNQSLLASIIANHSEQTAEKWAKGMVANMARQPKGNDRAQMAAAVIGECDIAIANSYYYALWLNSKDSKDQERAKKLGLFFPNQNTTGTHINISGAGITKHSKHRKAAIKLLEFLSEHDSQKWYANTNNEYPVNSNVPVSKLMLEFGYPFVADDLNLSKLGELNSAAVKIFDRAGWK